MIPTAVQDPLPFRPCVGKSRDLSLEFGFAARAPQFDAGQAHAARKEMNVRVIKAGNN